VANKGHRWTQTELDRLRAQRMEGMTWLEIGRSWGMGPSGVCQAYVRRWGYTGQRNPAYFAELCAPHSNVEIARRYGVTVWAVVAAKRRLRTAGRPVWSNWRKCAAPLDGLLSTP
jgi:hypothetical protein